jgi:DNA-binding LacI/PurR family transcriptional regulator
VTATRPPAMSDVASLAGVSHQTVSRVLNGHPNVRPETRERVLAAIAELGYRRNPAARALVTRRSGTIGVMSSGSALFGPSSTFIAVEGAAREAGLFVSVATIAEWDVAPVTAALDHFMDQGVDAVVVIAAHDDAIAAVRTFSASVPMVMVGPSELPPPLHAVSVDQYEGARLAVRHLLGLGHRDVVHLAGPTDWLDARRRIDGWRDELVAAGVEPGEPITGDWSAVRGYDVGRRLVAEGVPTAVFAANDQLALGLLRAFAEAGVRVPDDVSVVGFDDIEGAANFYPPLTTVRQEFRTLGERCMSVVVSVLAGEEPEPVLVPPSLVVRASSGPPRA